MHKVCWITSVLSKVEFCIVYALEKIDHDKVIESYTGKMGLAALEWIEAYNRRY